MNHSIQIWPPALSPEHSRPSELSHQLMHPGCATLHSGWVHYRQPKNRILDNLFDDFTLIFSFGIAFAYASTHTNIWKGPEYMGEPLTLGLTGGGTRRAASCSVGCAR